MEKFLKELSSLLESAASSGLSSIEKKRRIRRVNNFLQSHYEESFAQLDLKSVPDPDTGKTTQMQIHGYYERNVTFNECPGICFKIRITRIVAKGRQGHTHAVLPWFLTGWRTLSVPSLMAWIRDIRELLDKHHTVHKIATDLAVSYRFVRCLIEADKKFNSSIPLDTDNLPRLLSWSVSTFKQMWLQARSSSGGRIIYSGICPKIVL